MISHEDEGQHAHERPQGNGSPAVAVTFPFTLVSAEPIEFMSAFSDTLEGLEPIGKGGMGRVFKARLREPKQVSRDQLKAHADRSFPSDAAEGSNGRSQMRVQAQLRKNIGEMRSDVVALKIIELPNAEDTDAQKKSQRCRYRVLHRETEGMILADLPNTARIYGMHEHPQHLEVLMDYIDGFDVGQLHSALHSPSVSLEDRVRIISDFAALVSVALLRAHDAGLVHRDVKPKNIMITKQGEVVLTDFGLARSTDPNETRVTKTGEVLGTPAYMSPEQAHGERENIGPESDIFSLGITLIEMLTSRIPAMGRGGNVASTIEARRQLREGCGVPEHLEIPGLAELRTINPRLAGYIEHTFVPFLLAMIHPHRKGRKTNEQVAEFFQKRSSDADLDFDAKVYPREQAQMQRLRLEMPPGCTEIQSADDMVQALVGGVRRRAKECDFVDSLREEEYTDTKQTVDSRPPRGSPLASTRAAIAAGAFVVLSAGGLLWYLGKGNKEEQSAKAPSRGAASVKEPDSPFPQIVGRTVERSVGEPFLIEQNGNRPQRLVLFPGHDEVEIPQECLMGFYGRAENGERQLRATGFCCDLPRFGQIIRLPANHPFMVKLPKDGVIGYCVPQSSGRGDFLFTIGYPLILHEDAQGVPRPYSAFSGLISDVKIGGSIGSKEQYFQDLASGELPIEIPDLEEADPVPAGYKGTWSNPRVNWVERAKKQLGDLAAQAKNITPASHESASRE